MPAIAGAALWTPWGGIEETLAALACGTAPAQVADGDLVQRCSTLARAACGDRRPDLILFATTKADLPRWCEDLVGHGNGVGGPAWLADQLAAELAAPAFAVSAACASGTAAVGVAARWILAGRARRVLVLGADRLHDFVRAGFAALGAVDPDGCHPYDRDRRGLALGEAAAALLLDRDGGGIQLAGWGAAMDANHLTGPQRDGAGLARAISAAISRAGGAPPALAVGHGTGTRYNDDAESHAWTRAAPATPLVGWKGLLGHSLGACGLVELVLAAAALEHGRAPGTWNLRAPGTAASLHVLPPGAHAIAAGPIVCANAGFGGLDAAAVLDRRRAAPLAPTPARLSLRIDLRADGWSISGDRRDAGAWERPATPGELPRPGARELTGAVDASWGRMDQPCRLLVALALLAAPLPPLSGIVLLTRSGCAATDRAFEIARRAGQVDPQRFAYTLPTAPVGEASIRARLQGPGFALLGADDEQGRRVAGDLVRDGAPAVLLARVEADAPPQIAWAEVWTPAAHAG